MSVYTVRFVGIDNREQSAEVEAHGIQQAIHRFFDEHSPVMEVLYVLKSTGFEKGGL